MFRTAGQVKSWHPSVLTAEISMFLLPFVSWANHLQFWPLFQGPASCLLSPPCSAKPKWMTFGTLNWEMPADLSWGAAMLPGLQVFPALASWMAASLHTPQWHCFASKSLQHKPGVGCSFCGHKPHFHDMSAVPWGQAGTLKPPMEH